MPNYSLVLDTKFKPFSYDELIKPVLMQTQAQQAIEEEYSNLATKANIWDEMASEQSDPYAYKMYKTYSNELESRADQLMRYGLTPSSRRSLLDMKARYSKNIVPIENAYKRREELATEQRKAIAANPTLRYQRMAGQMSLDDFIRNPSLDYGESYSGALLTQQVSQAAANLQRALTDKGQLSKLGLPFQYERMLQYGATPAQVLAAMADQAQNEPETATFLRGIVDQVMESSGVADWADPMTLNEFRAFANQGLYSAIGQAKLDTFTDQAGLAQFKDRLAANRASAADREQGNTIKLSGVSYLQSSGDLGKYQRALAGLKGGQQGIKASVFGKDGSVNPLAVYDQAQAAMASAETKVKNQYASKLRDARSRAAYEIGGYGYESDKVKAIEAQMKSDIAKAKNQAYQNTLQKHGVTQGITKDQYEALKAIGYNGKSQMLSYSQLVEPLDRLAQERTYYSTNMSDYDIPDQKIRAQLGNWNINDNFSTAVYKLNSDGTQGDPVNYNDLKLEEGTKNKGRKVTGIYYSAFTPGKIIVQIGASGDRYLMDPNVLGSEVASLIRNTQRIIQEDPDVSLTRASVETTELLSKMLNSYNPTAPKSSKDAVE